MAHVYKRANRAKGDHTVEECNHRIKGVPIHYHPQTAKEGKPIVQIRTGAHQEDIIIPSREPIEIPGILGKKNFDRLKKQARVLTQEEKNAMLHEAEQKKRQLILESEKRKEDLRQKQNKAVEKGSILEEAESEALKKNQYMLQRAHELRQEQQDEVKTLNGIILASKCLAIREAQILEKKLVAQELEDEDRRLDMMMEQARQRAIAAEKQKQTEIEERNRQFVAEVKEQLKASEIQALIDRERREEEARNSNKLLVAFQHAKLQEIEDKKRKQEHAREDLRRSNEAAIQFRALKEEEERCLDIRLREFMQRKEREEAERIAQAAILKQCKESDIQRLGEKVKEQQELKTKREEMTVFRLHEEAEREWRRTEKEKVIKRKADIAKLREERQKQIEDIRRGQALEISRDQEEFYKVCKIQRESFEREKEKRAEDKRKAERNRRDLLKQVNRKEKERIEKRLLQMEEGEAMRIEEEVRKMQLRETLDRKMDVLRNSKLPDKTMQDIRRQTEKKIMAHLQ